MASNVVSDNFETGTGGVPQLGGADRQNQWCKAWVNFNGTGTVAIRDSFNVSSITDNGTATYTVNFTNAMANTNYCYGGSGASDATIGHEAASGNPTVAALPLRSRNASNSLVDQTDMNIIVFGD